MIKKSEGTSSPEINLARTEEEIDQKIDKINFEAITSKMKSKPFQKEKALKAIFTLALKLEHKLSGYETLLSDEVGARLVSLLFRKLIDQKRKEKGLDPVKVSFLATGEKETTTTETEIVEFIRNHKQELGKTLVLTELISTGKSMQRFIKVLKENSIQYELAAVSIVDAMHEWDPEESEELQNQEEGRLFWGEKGIAGLNLNLKHRFSGVIKDGKSAHPVKDLETIPGTVKLAREDINILAEEIYKIF